MATIIGSGGNDTITPSFSSGNVVGGKATAGADRISGAAGNDSIDGGGGGDTLDGGSGNDTLYGEAGYDRLTGGDGNDTLRGGDGNDTILGGAGGDVIDDGTAGVFGPPNEFGNDSIDGGSGSDTIFAYGRDTILGGEGDDIITVNSQTDAQSVLRGGAGRDTIRIVGAFRVESFSYAASGIEFITGYASVPGIYGTSANNILNFSGVRLTSGLPVYADAGNDRLIGSADDNRLYGHTGNDTVLGGAGNDTIADLAGFDSLNGGGGRDTLDYSEIFGAGGTIDLGLGRATFSGGNDTLAGFEDVRGSQGNDSIRGNGAGNVLDGQYGNDTILGLGGDDTISGLVGTDRLDGGGGRDTVDYGWAAGFFAGGTINLTTGQATIGGVAESISNFEDANGSQGSDTITGNGVGNRLAGLDGSDLLIGLAGSDTLTGGAGADTINGGAGADVFKYDFWQDSETAHRDQIIGFTGPGVAAGDRIDLSGAYPFTLTFVGTAAFSGVGQVRVVNAGTNTFVQVDIGPAPGAEMEIVIADGATDASAYTAADFIL